MILCHRCGRSKTRICFPPTPHCTCEPNEEDQRVLYWMEEVTNKMEDEKTAEELRDEATPEKGTVQQPLGGNNPTPEQGGVTPADGIDDPEAPRQGVPDEEGNYPDEQDPVVEG